MHCQWVSMTLLKKENISQFSDEEKTKQKYSDSRWTMEFYNITINFDEQWIEKMWKEKPNDKGQEPTILVECT